MPLEPTASTKGSQRPGEEMGKKKDVQWDDSKGKKVCIWKSFFCWPPPQQH